MTEKGSTLPSPALRPSMFVPNDYRRYNPGGFGHVYVRNQELRTQSVPTPAKRRLFSLGE